MTKNPELICTVCGQSFARQDLRAWIDVRAGISALIRADHPDWAAGGYICQADLARYRRRYVEAMLEDERGELGQLERQVIDSIAEGGLISLPPGEVITPPITFGEKMADRVADFGGSWTFILGFLVV